MTISKNKISNKVLSVLLCLAMLLSYLPFSFLTAFAADTPEAMWGTSADGLTNSGTLAEAIDAANADSNIKYIQLQKSIENVSSEYRITGGKFTLDLNGKNVSGSGYIFMVLYTGTAVTFVDSAETDGKVSTTGVSHSAVVVGGGAEVFIDGGKYEGGSAVLVDVSTASVTIRGGEFTGVKSNSQVICNNGTLEITGGSFTAGEYDWSAVCVGDSSVSTTIKGGKFVAGMLGTIEYFGGKLDLSECSDLTGITLSNQRDSAVTPGDDTIKLPAEHAFFDGSTEVDSLESFYENSKIYTIRGNAPAEAPEILRFDTPDLVYGSYKDVKVSVTVNEKDGYTYSYQWYNNYQKQDPIVGETSNTYTLPNDLARGKHSVFCVVTGTRKDNGLSAETEVDVGVYVSAAGSSLTSAPEAKTDLRFNGKWQELVTAGTAEGGSVWYLVTTQEIAQADINNYIFSSAIPKAANVGTYYVWYKVKGDSNHKDTKAENYVTVSIGKAQIEKPAENNTEFIYNGQEQSYFQTDTSGDSETNPVDPFEPVKPEGDEEEKQPVNPFEPSDEETDEETKENEDEQNGVFDGDGSNTSSVKLPAPGTPTDPVVTFDPYAYDIIGNTQTEVGTYTVKVSLKDKNSCEWEDGTTDDLFYDFVIAPRTTDITGTVAIGAMAGSVTMEAEYTGNETVAYQWYCDGEVISGATDLFYTPSYDDVGKVFKVVVTGTGNYNGSVTAEYVHSKDLTHAVLSLSNTDLVYNGQTQRPTVTVTYAGRVLQEGVDYEVFTWHESQPREIQGGIPVKFFGQPVDSINADKYYVQVKGKGDFTSANSALYTIKPAPLTVTANNKTITYGDAPANSGVTYSGFVNGEDAAVLEGALDYDYNYAQYGNVGSYEITPKGLTSDNYEITFQKGTLTVERREISFRWGATQFIPYNSNKQLPEVSVGNLVNEDTCELTVEVVETTEGAGINPGQWTAKITGISNTNYKLPVSGPLEVKYTIYGSQSAPDVVGVAETVKGKNDGYISGLTTEMEYATERTNLNSAYTRVTDPTMIFEPGTYYIRYAAKDYYYSSQCTEVTVNEGRNLTVIVPQNQIGYTLTVDKTEFEYMGGPTITLVIAEGYSKSENFAVKLNGIDMHWGDFTQIGTQSCTEDLVITVEGVADITPPTSEINIKGNKWTNFWNELTFGLFFKETQDVTITATDAGSGVNSIEYYLADSKLTLEEVEDIADWECYNGIFKVNPDNKYVVYAKITDNAGNITYISSDGLVFDATAPALIGIENNGVYYGEKVFKAIDDNFLKIEIDGIDVTDTSQGDDEYKIIADNAEHTVTVTDKAGNITEWKITVYKQYTVTFMDENGVYKAVTVKHGEKIEMPEVPKKDGYTVTWEKEIDTVTANVTVKAFYTKIPVADTNSTQTGDNSNMMLWIALFFISGGAVIALTVVDRKRRMTSKNK